MFHVECEPEEYDGGEEQEVQEEELAVTGTEMPAKVSRYSLFTTHFFHLLLCIFVPSQVPKSEDLYPEVATAKEEAKMLKKELRSEERKASEGGPNPNHGM